jgi:hypothetical protein
MRRAGEGECTQERTLTTLGDWPRGGFDTPFTSSTVALLARGLDALASFGSLLLIRGTGCDEFVREVGVGGAGALLVTTMFDEK